MRRSQYLNWPVSLTRNLQLNPLPSLTQRNPPLLYRDHRARHVLALIRACIWQGKRLHPRHGQETPI
jgi:hypothetical protein